MYPISQEVMALFEADYQKVLRITGEDENGATITITDNNVIADSFQIDRYSCNGEKLEIGTAISAQLTLTLENGDGRYDGIVFEDAELFVEVGIADWTQADPEIQWVPCGYFTPDEQPRGLLNIRITAFDRMMRFDAVPSSSLMPWTTQAGVVMTTQSGDPIYFVRSILFPCTIEQMAQQMAKLCNVPFTQDLSGLPNANVSITALMVPTKDVTYRMLIQWCAAIMGCNAWIDWNGELRFSWYSNATNYVSTIDNRFSSDLYENDLAITGVTYTNVSGIKYLEGSADYTVDIVGNLLIGGYIATMLPAINTALNGFTYRPFTAATVNAPYLWPMDVITFRDKNGDDHTGALTNVTFGLNGSTALESKGMTYATNRGVQPSGFTTAQAQLVNEVKQSIVELDDSLTQQEIFNRLTDDGVAQGIVLYNGQLYINASYINAGTLNVRYINFNAPANDFDVPDENEPDSLLDGQRVSNGWIVNTDGSSEIVALACRYAKLIRGRRITLNFRFRGDLDTCEARWWNLDGSGGSNITEPVSTPNPYTYYFTVPDDADRFELVMSCGGLRQISASVSGSAIVYPDDIRFNYAGMQIGAFSVDRSGNVEADGYNVIGGATRFTGNVSMVNPLPVSSGGTGAMTNAVYVEDNYDSLLDVINAVRNSRVFPISIQKAGSHAYSDMPSGCEANEFNALLVGNENRLTVLLFIYGDTRVFRADCFNGRWLNNWSQII